MSEGESEIVKKFRNLKLKSFSPKNTKARQWRTSMERMLGGAIALEGYSTLKRFNFIKF